MSVRLKEQQAWHRPCAICGRDEARLLFRPRTSPGPVVRCQRCGLVYVSPVEDGRALIRGGPVLGDRSLALLASDDPRDLVGCWELADLSRRNVNRSAIRANAEAALDRIERIVQPPGRLLDFGCAWGFFLRVAAERGWEPYGLEPLPGHAVYARASAGATVIADVLHDDSFEPDYFDVVTALQVFEHLPDPAGDLERLCRLLRPGGVFLIEVPNIETWSVRLLREWHRHFNPDHLTFFSAETLGALLEKHGFTVIEIYYPSRFITLHHLVSFWFGRYLPGRPVSLGEVVVRRLGLLDKMIRVNLGDIVAAIARKPE